MVKEETSFAQRVESSLLVSPLQHAGPLGDKISNVSESVYFFNVAQSSSQFWSTDIVYVIQIGLGCMFWLAKITEVNILGSWIHELNIYKQPRKPNGRVKCVKKKNLWLWVRPGKLADPIREINCRMTQYDD